MRRAIELDESDSPLPSDHELWAAHDALGISLIMRKKYRDAVGILMKSRDLAERIGDDSLLASAEYNLACASSRAGKFKDAYVALKASIALDSTNKEKAKSDSDLEKAVERQEFKELLK